MELVEGFYTHFQPDFAFRLVKHDFAPVVTPGLVANLHFILFSHFFYSYKRTKVPKAGETLFYPVCPPNTIDRRHFFAFL